MDIFIRGFWSKMDVTSFKENTPPRGASLRG